MVNKTLHWDSCVTRNIDESSTIYFMHLYPSIALDLYWYSFLWFSAQHRRTRTRIRPLHNNMQHLSHKSITVTSSIRIKCMVPKPNTMERTNMKSTKQQIRSTARSSFENIFQPPETWRGFAAYGMHCAWIRFCCFVCVCLYNMMLRSICLHYTIANHEHHSIQF